jgi:hypothetical protein
MIMNKLGSEQNAQVTPKQSGWSKLIRIGVKSIIGVSLMVAGAALAQNAGIGVPQLKPVDESKIEAPTTTDLNQAPPPGSQREAKACSDDIKLYCAPQTQTRRDVRQCFADKSSQISQSCKAYLDRVADDEAE